MNKKELDAAEMETANLIIDSCKKAWDGPVVSAWDKETPIMMGNTKQQVMTGVVKVKIAKPEFDIEKYEFSEKMITEAHVYDNELHLEVSMPYWSNGEDTISFTKEDIEAMLRSLEC